MSCRAAAVAAVSGWLLCVSPVAAGYDASGVPLVAQGTLQAAFTPGDDVEGLIIGAIDGARRQVLVQAYLLTSKKIAAALITAKRRGIDVRVLADAKQHAKVETSRIPALAAAGIAVWLETGYENAHNKVIVIDASTPDAAVITGSYNFTWTAQHKNAENILLARRNPALAARYALNWERHRLDATPYRK
ncbi:MAG: phospholipase family protein [Herminiimonas sp.]|nr:phospholipase family protein [Herminiimonas sp.]